MGVGACHALQDEPAGPRAMCWIAAVEDGMSDGGAAVRETIEVIILEWEQHRQACRDATSDRDRLSEMLWLG
jgi:hypothetical protein